MVAWLVFVAIAVATYFVVTGFAVFPPAYKTLFLFVIGALIVLSALFFFLTRGRGRSAVSIICIILSILLIAGTVVAYRLNKKMQDIFVVPESITEIDINIYALKDENTDQEILNHKADSFIIQSAVDQENQTYALSQLEKTFGTAVSTVQKEDLISAVAALFNKEGNLLIMSEAYEELIKGLEGYEDFSEKTEVIYTVTKEEKVTPKDDKKENTKKKGDITDTPFTVYVAGFDGSSFNLSIYGRVDVNILLSVNPNTKQILLIGVPRDTYVPNPALGNGFDKLTHLGWFNGITNSMEGVGDYIGIDIEHYVTVNFYTFRSILNAIGGVDIDNPYAFYSSPYIGYYFFPEGKIHLDGDNGLSYVRERKTLSNGDYSRNAHQVLVLKAILKKVMSKEILSHYEALLDALKGQFVTDISSSDLIKLAVNQLNSDKDWELITYNLGGQGAMQGTATLGYNWKLYTVNMFESQREFVKDQVNKVMNDEIIKQEELPDADKTTYIPN